MFPDSSLHHPTLLTSDLPISDNWEGDITILPYESSSEESTMELLDKFIGTQIPLETKKGPVLAKFISKKRSSDGTLVGCENREPMFDSRQYNVKFPGGHFEQYSANVLHESLSTRLDDQGYNLGHIKELCGYLLSSKMTPSHKLFATSSNENKTYIATTKGCDIKVRWNDDQTT